MDFDLAIYTIMSGIVVGTLAGLFGVGGGVIVVPVLTLLFRKIGMSEEVIGHTAIGTSLATIFFTSMSSLYTHHMNKAVLWKVFLILTPGILLGAWLGSFFAASLKSNLLIGIFIFFVFIFSSRMIISSLRSKDKETSNSIDTNERGKLPNFSIQSLIGIIIGFSSSLVGIGGGVFTSNYLLYFRTPIHLAIGTSAAIGFPIAIAGTLSYIVNGWNNPLLFPGSLGFVFLPGLVGIVVGSIPFAFLGAKLSHRLDKKKLKFLFGIFLFTMGLYMAYQEIY